MSERFAIFYTLPAENLVYQRAADWLQYDAYKGQKSKNLDNNQRFQESSKEYTKNASKYGFHATLKPPFRLAQDKTEQQLVHALNEFCLELEPINLGYLQIKSLSSFVALCLNKPNPELQNLAMQCVKRFDYFRAELTSEEYAKRQPKKLSFRQKELLDKWGYPFVADEFRFHMTLTDTLAAEQLESVKDDLSSVFNPLLSDTLYMDKMYLFHQQKRDSKFKIIHSFDLGLNNKK